MSLSQLTALYSPLDIAFAQALSGPYEDMSVINSRVELIAGMKNGVISGFWRPMVAVGDDRELKLHIQNLYDICHDIYYMDFLIDGKLSVIASFLLRQGYRAKPYYTQIIDCKKTEGELHSDLRKSYKSLVNKDTNVRQCTVDEYHELHLKHKGETRPRETWGIQAEMNAVCFRDGDSGVMFYVNPWCAYYASGCGDNAHACIWRAITSLEVNFIEMGEQVLYGDAKLVNISKFKRGFGGFTQARLILEKGIK